MTSQPTYVPGWRKWIRRAVPNIAKGVMEIDSHFGQPQYLKTLVMICQRRSSHHMEDTSTYSPVKGAMKADISEKAFRIYPAFVTVCSLTTWRYE